MAHWGAGPLRGFMADKGRMTLVRPLLWMGSTGVRLPHAPHIPPNQGGPLQGGLREPQEAQAGVPFLHHTGRGYSMPKEKGKEFFIPFSLHLRFPS